MVNGISSIPPPLTVLIGVIGLPILSAPPGPAAYFNQRVAALVGLPLQSICIPLLTFTHHIHCHPINHIF